MPRTPGAKNRTPREMRKDGEHQIEQARLKEKNERLRRENEELKKRKR